MKRLRYRIKLLSPTVLTARKPFGNFFESLTYLPGTAVRGAFGSRLFRRCQEQGHALDHHNQQTCPFYRLLLLPAERVCFGDLLPAHARFGYGGWLPLTATSCKKAPGFLEEAQHGVQDTLLQTIALEMALEAGFPMVPIRRCGYRGRCRERLEPFSGFFARFQEAGESLQVATRVITRSARDRKRGTAFENALFSFQAIEAEQAFAGEIRCPSETIADLVKAEFPAETELAFGRFRSSGSGRAIIVAVGEAEPESETLQQRLKVFNQRLREELRTYDPYVQLPSDAERFFALTLMAPAVLRDDMHLPVVGISEAVLQMELQRRGLRDCQCTLVRSFCRGEVREGWDLAHRLPRETTLLTAAGSVAVFQTRDQRVLDLLESLESEGIGTRQEEGFGQVKVCHFFHLKEGVW